MRFQFMTQVPKSTLSVCAELGVPAHLCWKCSHIGDVCRYLLCSLITLTFFHLSRSHNATFCAFILWFSAAPAANSVATLYVACTQCATAHTSVIKVRILAFNVDSYTHVLFAHFFASMCHNYSDFGITANRGSCPRSPTVLPSILRITTQHFLADANGFCRFLWGNQMEILAAFWSKFWLFMFFTTCYPQDDSCYLKRFLSLMQCVRTSPNVGLELLFSELLLGLWRSARALRRR